MERDHGTTIAEQEQRFTLALAMCIVNSIVAFLCVLSADYILAAIFVINGVSFVFNAIYRGSDSPWVSRANLTLVALFAALCTVQLVRLSR
jgi:hypothetical protein